MKIFAITFLFCSLLFSGEGFSQDQSAKWSVKTAQSFIKRFPNPDTMYCCGNTNHFSWQAGYVMFAMEKIWKSTGDPTYFNYIQRYEHQGFRISNFASCDE
jgi:rhamnogalacturonyl hydrolase YesR